MTQAQYEQRLERQRERQRRHRQRHRDLKRPGRDDIARVALHWMLTRAAQTDMLGQLAGIEEALVARLVAQGFSKAASYEVFDDLIDKYADGRWRFRRKPHLLFAGTPPVTS